MGTRFIASHEANAVEVYKKRITEIRAEDTRVTRSFSGKPMRVIANRWVEEWEQHPEDIQSFPQQLLVSIGEGAFAAMGRRPDENIDPDRACMPCGQGAGAVHEILSCREIVDGVMREARETIEQLAGLL